MQLRAGLAKIWNDPVWSKVIAAGIIAGLSYVYLLWTQTPPAGRWTRLVLSLALGMGIVGALSVLLWSRRRTAPKTLVFLSSGGTCRDPMAKAITAKLLQTKKLKKPLKIKAAALGPLSDSQASYAARYVIKEMYGEDLLADHRPELLSPELVQEADLILAMDKTLLLTPGKTLPTTKTFVLREFFGLSGDISDPWPDGKDPATLARYRDCAHELRQILSQHLDQLVAVLEV